MGTNATREGRELHGHVVLGRTRVSLPRSGTVKMTMMPLEDRRALRCSSSVASRNSTRAETSRAESQHTRVADELNWKKQLWATRETRSRMKNSESIHMPRS